VYEARDERLETIRDYYDTRAQALRDRTSSYRALPPDALYLTAEEWDARAEAHPVRRFTPSSATATMWWIWARAPGAPSRRNGSATAAICSTPSPSTPKP
jgi:hypothetical protein